MGAPADPFALGLGALKPPLLPGAAIFFTVLSFNLAGEALNEMLDPRARTAGV